MQTQDFCHFFIAFPCFLWIILKIILDFWRLNGFFVSNLSLKLYKFGKKVIALDRLDDYDDKFGYVDFK